MHSKWPLGKIPKEFQRPEPEQIKELGYNWNKPHEIVEMFEKEITEYAGSKYAVAVDCDTNAIFLCLKYLKEYKEIITLPSHTYISVPNIVVTAGYKRLNLEEEHWEGLYQIKPLNVWDSAGRFTKGMYIGGDNFQTLSFQIKKRLPIGRGGMVLTDNKEAYDWLVKARYDGRDLNKPQTEDNIEIFGYHMYMTPEDAARGLILFNQLNTEHEDTHTWCTHLTLATNREV